MREADPLVILDCELYSAFGPGLRSAWDALLEGRHAFAPCRRFGNPYLETMNAACAPELDGKESIPDFLLDYLAPAAKHVFGKTELFLADTLGEIERIDNQENRCTSDSLLEKALRKFEIASGRIVSAACASSNTAICRAASLIEQNVLESAVILGLDYVSEFVLSGFATLNATASEPVARPYDRDRSGLLLGDAGALCILTRRSTALRERRKIRAVLSGWGMSCDALHITAPAMTGDALAEAIRRALHKANLVPGDIGAVIGHGTGTRYNDTMEIAALRRVFPDAPALVSVKGSSGHTLGAAGLLQLDAALGMFETDKIPPQTSLRIPEPGAETMVSDKIRPLGKRRILSMNSGFGGLNSVLLLEAPHD